MWKTATESGAAIEGQYVEDSMPVEDKKRGRPPRVHPADHSVNAASLRLLNGYERVPIQIVTSSSKQNKRNRALAGIILRVLD